MAMTSLSTHQSIDHTKQHIYQILLAAYCLLWFLINTAFLLDYPFVHSDEPWLSGLTRWMMQIRNIAVTEPFFDAYPRAPHAVKLVFHLLQMGWIRLFGYSIITVRLLSLLFGSFSLMLFYRLLRRLSIPASVALLGTVLLSLDIQFIYASHMARQEILLVFMLLITTDMALQRVLRPESSLLTDITAGILAGLSFGIHPNGILIGAAGGSIYLLALVQHRIRRSSVAAYATGALGCILLFILISLWENPRFFQDYASYGATLGVLETPANKLRAYPRFLQKLYYGVSGTYYIPNIRLQLILFAVIVPSSVILSISSSVFRAQTMPILTALLAMQIGFISIGRYGQPSVIIFFPYCYILAIAIIIWTSNTITNLHHVHRIRLQHLIPLIRIGTVMLGIVILGIISEREVRNTIRSQSSYTSYASQISSIIPDTARVLGNLNTEYLFEAGNLYDWRNLEPAYRQGVSFAEYIDKHSISYIIYPAELDEIYARRPIWNGIYGNVALYYQDMQEFLRQRGTIIFRGVSRTYAMRIVRYQQDQEWGFTIYAITPMP